MTEAEPQSAVAVAGALPALRRAREELPPVGMGAPNRLAEFALA